MARFISTHHVHERNHEIALELFSYMKLIVVIVKLVHGTLDINVMYVIRLVVSTPLENINQLG